MYTKFNINSLILLFIFSPLHGIKIIFKCNPQNIAKYCIERSYSELIKQSPLLQSYTGRRQNYRLNESGLLVLELTNADVLQFFKYIPSRPILGSWSKQSIFKKFRVNDSMNNGVIDLDVIDSNYWNRTNT